MNLLRLPPPLAAAGVAVEAELSLDPPKQGSGAGFRRSGLLGPQLAGWRANVMTGIQQSFPAWLDITALSDELRICRGQNAPFFVCANGTTYPPSLAPSSRQTMSW